jgi:V8-like Glu-specific endopeptidase
MKKIISNTTHIILLSLILTMSSCKQEKRTYPVATAAGSVATSEELILTDDQPRPLTPPEKEIKRPSPTMHVPTVNNQKSEFYKRVDLINIDPNFPSGGAVFYLQPDSAEASFVRCNSFLVGKNLLLTNAHCIESLKDQQCSEKVMIKVRTNDGTKITGCRKIVYASPYEKDNSKIPDFALLELTDSIENAKIYNIAREGIAPEKKYTIHALDYYDQTGGIVEAKYNKKECKALYHSYTLFFHDAPLPDRPQSDDFKRIGRSLIINFQPFDSESKCDTRKGNSGSMITNDRDEVVAILSSHTIIEESINLKDKILTAYEEQKTLNKRTTFDLLDFPQSFKEIPLATNFTCLRTGHPSLDKNFPSDLCNEYLTKFWDSNLNDYISYADQQKNEFIDYKINYLVDKEIANRFEKNLKQSFPHIEFVFFKVSQETAQKYAKDFDLSNLSPHKNYLVFYPTCKHTAFQSADYTMRLPLYQIDLLDQFDEYFRFTRTASFQDIKVNYIVSTKQLSRCQ